MHQCKRMFCILISIVINVNLGIHSVLNFKNYKVSCKDNGKDSLCFYLPPLLIVLNGIWGRGGTLKNNRRFFSAVVQEF